MFSADPDLNAMLADCAEGFREVWTGFAGCRIRWLAGGAGPPLVLLHGDYGSWTHWIRNISTLCTRYEVWVPDLPGYGASATPSGEFSEQHLAELVSGALRSLTVEASYRLAGFSFGGIVAGHLAAQEGDRVSHLVVCGPGGLGAPRPSEMPNLERSTPRLGRSATIAIQQRNLAKLMISDPAKVDEMAGRIHLENIEHTRVRAWDIPHTTTLLEIMPRISARISAIWGGNDRYSGPDTAAESERLMRQFHPNLKFDIIDGAGHWVPYENPASFNQLLLTALQD
jgi:pimeloyl-ACP methyl ester carboxylesterase